ncbi:MAG: hypothetical protein ACOYL1_06635, partial [Chlamydiia bacterium]
MASLWQQKQFVLTAQTALAAWGIILFANTYPLNLWGYYAYSAPLLVLGFAATASARFKHALTGLFMTLTLLALLFACRLTDRSEQQLDHYFPIYPESVLVDGVWLTPEQAQVLPLVEKINVTIQQHPLDHIFVASDLPLAYFLSQHQNVTPYTYAFDARAMGMNEAQLNTLLYQRGVTHLLADVGKGNGWNLSLLHLSSLHPSRFGVP